MSTPTDSGATDVNGAVSRISAMLQQPELERPTGTGETPEEPKRAQEGADVHAEELDSNSETPEGDTQELSRRFKAKLGDQEVEFDLVTDGIDPDLIPKGLMMEADYRKKTMELGDSRKALETKQLELDAKFNDAAELIQFEADNLESQDMLELKEYDPETYWKKVDQVKQKAEKLTKWREEKRQQFEKQSVDILQKEAEKLPQAIPDWLDTSKRDADLEALKPYLSDFGFNEHEVQAFGVNDGRPTDSRLLAMARKAMMFDSIKSQDLEAKRVKPKPKSVTPSGGKVSNPENDALKTKAAKLKKTGKLADAQAAISEMFKL